MPRATLVINLHVPEEVEAAEVWLETWELHLNYLSENLGCGCCVDMFNVDAPHEALEELPERLSASSERADSERFA